MASSLRLLLAGLFIVGMMSSFASQAYTFCQHNEGVTAKTTRVSFGKIVIPRDYAIGRVIKEIYLGEVEQLGDIAYCDHPTYVSWDEPAFKRAHYNYDAIYDSGVPGVGIRINTWGPGFGIDWLPRVSDRVLTCYPSQEATGKIQYCGKTWGYLTLQLVKIAPTTGSGKLEHRLLTRARLNRDVTIHTFYLADTEIVTQGCSLTQTTTYVNMGNIKTSEFRGVNSTAGTKGFTLRLDCNANLTVSVSLDGRPAKNSSNNIWALDYSNDNATAKGIGLQILLFNRTLSMREPFLIRSSNAIRHFYMPLQARYIQTKPRITPGKANATATITLTYP
ncbi:fimbrial protein [Xenorhabdus szentirmaii]|uniref:Uncharacterized protein n=1 Tax=Xenorhabdus szentirmaii DSM 16338 TaxID=1427518 RepID=W1IVS9_9GAMM|nr:MULTISPECIES: fimbrial protein [Xenorhabdus]MBD2792603.1 type 1 fimbrial protein [Xenorhabdus sp. CUL]MBD2824878.1 type 1 fimbrial protein [Xenorhabdus sp. 5]PHM32658.1 fimbrial adhesin protein precursor [Xenorhabdus szentirmaii DSM 16338]CDL81908.1 conserved exported hypothetical protein [Xenorhabdus szentirmaii DSM 16338]